MCVPVVRLTCTDCSGMLQFTCTCTCITSHLCWLQWHVAATCTCVPVVHLTCTDCSGMLRRPVRVYLYYVSPALIAAGAVHVLAGAQQCSDSARREPWVQTSVPHHRWAETSMQYQGTSADAHRRLCVLICFLCIVYGASCTVLQS